MVGKTLVKPTYVLINAPILTENVKIGKFTAFYGPYRRSLCKIVLLVKGFLHSDYRKFIVGNDLMIMNPFCKFGKL